MSDFTRKIITSLLPPGTAWEPAIESDFDKFLDGKALNYDDIKNFIDKLSSLRDPLETSLLDELEIEYGVTKNDNFTDAQRRQYLNSLVFSTKENGTPDDLEKRLQDAGFPVQIHSNDPATNPKILLNENYQMIAGGPNAYAGREDAFARRIGGELIVNGDQFQQKPNYISVAGSANAFAGNTNFKAGMFNELIKLKIEYDIPEDPNSWPFMFYIGGNVTRDINGFIIDLERVILPLSVKNEFLTILLKYKPLYTWGISVVDFI